MTNDRRRDRVIKLGLALPEATASQSGPLGQHTTFRVRERTFAYFVIDEHGDGRVALLTKAAPGVQATLVASDPARYFAPKYIGPRGWVGFDFDAGKVDWGEVNDLLTESYRLVATKGLVAQV